MSTDFEVMTELERAGIFLPGSAAAIGSASPVVTSRDAEIREGHSEAVDLVQRVFSGTPGSGPQVVVFTSAERGAGCSWVCARASETLAACLGGRVCVVDANLRSPTLHRYFGLDNRSGLAQALLTAVPVMNFVQEVPDRRLSVLPSGMATAQQSGLLISDRLPSVIAELRREFAYVLIDCPAATVYADVTMLGPLVDGVILVLKSASTRREAARTAKETLVAAKYHLLGAVLNNRTFPIPESIYRRL